MLREIQKGGDDLREDLNRLLISDDDPRLRITARLLWASKRAHLEERLRRLDLLRMRFLVIYMNIVAATTTAAAEKVEKSTSPMDPEKAAHRLAQPMFPLALDEGVKRKPPLRRLTTQAMGNAGHGTPRLSEGNHRQGWAGVVQELQRSPLMHKRHASIEMSTTRISRSRPLRLLSNRCAAFIFPPISIFRSIPASYGSSSVLGPAGEHFLGVAAYRRIGRLAISSLWWIACARRLDGMGDDGLT